MQRLSRLRLSLTVAALLASLAAPAFADATSGALPVPQVIRPTTFTWNGRGTAATTAGGFHPVPQGLDYVPFQTIEQRSAALDAITRQRYVDAMAKNKVRGEGVRVQLRGARY